MVFRKNMAPFCGYCRHAAAAEPGTVICRKRGIMPENGSCRRFSYDPLRRTPPKPISPNFTKYDDRDYSL